jgi:hypothetical protein
MGSDPSPRTNNIKTPHEQPDKKFELESTFPVSQNSIEKHIPTPFNNGELRNDLPLFASTSQD